MGALDTTTGLEDGPVVTAAAATCHGMDKAASGRPARSTATDSGTDPDGDRIVLASDRDFGLFIFRYTGNLPDGE